VTDVAYVSSSSGGDMIETELAPGASAEFTLDTTNFNGSSASDQVYGFGGFEAPNDEQRRILMRRQVIDSLVGFGGWMPGVELGMGSARGPYVIGWQDAPGPVPVTVDDQVAQRYSQSVEVHSVRPTIGPGEVEISPAQMAVSVLATDGVANNGGPGTVMLGEGSVVYSIALPLEATDMRVSELSLIVGPDPSMVLTDRAASAASGRRDSRWRSVTPPAASGPCSATSASRTGSRSRIRPRRSATPGAWRSASRASRSIPTSGR
jgi:hypothetical protein